MNVAVGRKDLQNTRLFEASALAPPGQSNDQGERERENIQITMNIYSNIQDVLR